MTFSNLVTPCCLAKTLRGSQIYKFSILGLTAATKGKSWAESLMELADLCQKMDPFTKVSLKMDREVGTGARFRVVAIT